VTEPLAPAGPDKPAAAKDALTACFAEYRKGDALVMPNACWFVQAQTDGNNPAVTMMFVPIARAWGAA
jgi:hypothetical protein